MEVRKIVNVEELVTLEGLTPKEEIMAAIQFRYVNSDGYKNKLNEIQRKIEKKLQDDVENLKRFFIKKLNDAIYRNIYYKGTDKKASSVGFYVDVKFMEALPIVLRCNELSDYTHKITLVNYILSKCFENIPLYVRFYKKVIK